MEQQREIDRAIGRYRASWPYLIFPVLTGVVQICVHLVPIVRMRASAWDYIVIGIFAVLLVTTSVLPATILSTAGFRQAPRYRLIAWDDVASVFPAGPGDPDVLVGMCNGRRVSLRGVRQDRRVGVGALMTASPHPVPEHRD